MEERENWFVAHIVPNADTFLIAWLDFLGFKVHQFTHTRSRRRRPPIVVQSFPGYLFVKFDLFEDRWRMLHSVPGIIKLLPDQVNPIGLREEELDALREWHDYSFASDKPRSTWLKGQALSILEGPFAGLSAEFQSERHDLVQAMVSVFGRSVPATFRRQDVKEKSHACT